MNIHRFIQNQSLIKFTSYSVCIFLCVGLLYKYIFTRLVALLENSSHELMTSRDTNVELRTEEKVKVKTKM